MVKRFEFFQAAHSQLLDFSYHTEMVLKGYNKSSRWFLCFSVFVIDESRVLHSFPEQFHDYLIVYVELEDQGPMTWDLIRHCTRYVIDLLVSFLEQYMHCLPHNAHNAHNALPQCKLP